MVLITIDDPVVRSRLAPWGCAGVHRIMCVEGTSTRVAVGSYVEDMPCALNQINISGRERESSHNRFEARHILQNVCRRPGGPDRLTDDVW